MKNTLKKNRGALFRGVQAAVLLTIFYFLGRNLSRSWRELVAYPWNPDLRFLTFSLVLTVACGLLTALGWNLILRVMGQRVSLPRIIRIYYLSELAKYLPGKIWTTVGRVIMTEREGVPRVVTAASVGMMLVVLTVSGLLVVLGTLPLWPTLEVARRLRCFSLLLPLGLLCLHPRVFEPVLGWFLKKVENVELQVRLRYRNVLLLVFYWGGLWIIAGVATYCLLRAVYHGALPGPLTGCLLLAGVSALSWVVGVVSFIAPAGLGVAEVVLVVLFSSLFNMETGVATAIALFSRVWWITAELIGVGLTFRLK